MSNLVNQTAELLALLPEDEILLVNSLVKKLVLAWDPEYTKVTPSERLSLEIADREMKKGEFFNKDEVWS